MHTRIALISAESNRVKYIHWHTGTHGRSDYAILLKKLKSFTGVITVLQLSEWLATNHFLVLFKLKCAMRSSSLTTNDELPSKVIITLDSIILL